MRRRQPDEEVSGGGAGGGGIRKWMRGWMRFQEVNEEVSEGG